MNEKFKSKEASLYVGLGPDTLSVWRSTRHYPQPAYVKIGNRVWYLKKDLDDFLEQQTVRVGATA